MRTGGGWTGLLDEVPSDRMVPWAITKTGGTRRPLVDPPHMKLMGRNQGEFLVKPREVTGSHAVGMLLVVTATVLPLLEVEKGAQIPAAVPPVSVVGSGAD